MISDTEHLFMYILDICMTFLQNVSSDPLPIFKLDVFRHLVILVLYVFFILIPYQICDLQNTFSYSVGCLFILLIVSFAVQKLFWFDMVPFIYFVFVASAFGVI